jgi:hypothetical protein
LYGTIVGIIAGAVVGLAFYIALQVMLVLSNDNLIPTGKQKTI